MSLIKSNLPGWPVVTDFFDDDWFKNRFPAADWTPAVNVVENEDNYEIEVAAPGIKKNEFDVTVENRVLTISGKTEKEDEEKDKNYTRKEFSSRSFKRSFTLPDNLQEDSIEATYEDGILRIMLAKAEVDMPRKKQVSIQ